MLSNSVSLQYNTKMEGFYVKPNRSILFIVISNWLNSIFQVWANCTPAYTLLAPGGSTTSNLYKFEKPCPKVHAYHVWSKLAHNFQRRFRKCEQLTDDARPHGGRWKDDRHDAINIGHLKLSDLKFYINICEHVSHCLHVSLCLIH